MEVRGTGGCLGGRVLAAAQQGDAVEATVALAELDAVAPTPMLEPDLFRAGPGRRRCEDSPPPRFDKDFRVQMEHDPRAALDGYVLPTDELGRRAAQVVADHHDADPIARRTAQAGFFALLRRPGSRRSC